MIFKYLKQHFYLLLILAYFALLVGILLPQSRDFCLPLVLWLLLYTLVLVLADESWIKSRWWAYLLIPGIAFGLMYTGLQYGYAFDGIRYGSTLGFKYLAIPLVLVAHWLMISISARSLVHLLTRSPWLSAFLAALLITAYDLLLEQVAARFGWWAWNSAEVPVLNYVSWFVCALLCQFCFGRVPGKAGRSYWALMVQCLFFWVLLIM